MKKILAYLLVLVSLMTLFCGTAGAADNSMDKNGMQPHTYPCLFTTLMRKQQNTKMFR